MRGMLAPLDHRLRLELLLNPIKLALVYNGCVKAFVHFTLVSDLSYIDGIDQNVVYAPTAPVSLWPESIYGALYLTETPKLFIEIIDMPDIRGSLFTYLERLYLGIRVNLIAPGALSEYTALPDRVLNISVFSHAQSCILPLFQNQPRDHPTCSYAVCQVSTLTEKCRRPFA